MYYEIPVEATRRARARPALRNGLRCRQSPVSSLKDGFSRYRQQFLATLPVPDAPPAEKVEAMTRLRLAHSRMKDLFDIVLLSKRFDFEGICSSGRYARRSSGGGTPLPDGLPVALTEAFAGDPTKNTQW